MRCPALPSRKDGRKKFWRYRKPAADCYDWFIWSLRCSLQGFTSGRRHHQKYGNTLTYLGNLEHSNYHSQYFIFKLLMVRNSNGDQHPTTHHPIFLPKDSLRTRFLGHNYHPSSTMTTRMPSPSSYSVLVHPFRPVGVDAGCRQENSCCYRAAPCGQRRSQTSHHGGPGSPSHRQDEANDRLLRTVPRGAQIPLRGVGDLALACRRPTG